jgi:hypothetical protein
MASRKLAEVATNLIIARIKSEIAAALADVRTDRVDGKVSTEVPRNYFIYEKAIGFQAPAVFVICQEMDFRKAERGANHINAVSRFGVSVLIEDIDCDRLTIKAWRYQAALHKILDQTHLDDVDETMKIVVKVNNASFSPVFTNAGESPNNFRKEVVLNCDVEHYESF